MASFSWQIVFLQLVFVRLSETHCQRFERVECYSHIFLLLFVITGSTSLIRLFLFHPESKLSPTETDEVGSCK